MWYNDKLMICTTHAVNTIEKQCGGTTDRIAVQLAQHTQHCLTLEPYRHFSQCWIANSITHSFYIDGLFHYILFIVQHLTTTKGRPSILVQ